MVLNEAIERIARREACRVVAEFIKPDAIRAVNSANGVDGSGPPFSPVGAAQYKSPAERRQTIAKVLDEHLPAPGVEPVLRPLEVAGPPTGGHATFGEFIRGAGKSPATEEITRKYLKAGNAWPRIQAVLRGMLNGSVPPRIDEKGRLWLTIGPVKSLLAEVSMRFVAEKVRDDDSPYAFRYRVEVRPDETPGKRYWRPIGVISGPNFRRLGEGDWRIRVAAAGVSRFMQKDGEFLSLDIQGQNSFGQGHIEPTPHVHTDDCVREAKERISALTQEVAKKKADLVSARVAVEAYEGDVKEARAERDRFERDRDEAQRMASKLKREQSEILAALGRVEKERDEEAAKVQHLRDQIRELVEDRDDARTRADVWKDEAIKSNREGEALAKVRDQLGTDLADMMQQRDAYNRKYEDEVNRVMHKNGVIEEVKAVLRGDEGFSNFTPENARAAALQIIRDRFAV